MNPNYRAGLKGVVVTLIVMFMVSCSVRFIGEPDLNSSVITTDPNAGGSGSGSGSGSGGGGGGSIVTGDGLPKLFGGYSHQCVIKDGAAQCWGDNVSGQLGHVQVNNCSGGTYPCAKTGTSVRNTTDTGALPTVTTLSNRAYHTCAVSNGSVHCFGQNTHGELGDGTQNNSDLPVLVSGAWNSGVTSVAAAGEHSCALKSGGVWCWGANYANGGYLGNNDFTGSESLTPLQVTDAADVPISGVKKLVAGLYHSCVITTADGVKCWGSAGTSGHLGNGQIGAGQFSAIPVDVTGLTSGVKDLVAGGDHTCALKTNDEIWCWGRNLYTQLGQVTASNSPSAVPIQVQGLPAGTTPVAIGAGHDHACAILNDNTAWCWGYNFYGQLGNGATATRSLPVQVQGLTGTPAEIAGGYQSTCAAVGATVSCWGDNGYGQLGDGTETDSLSPKAVILQ